MFMYSYCYVCSVLCSLLQCVILCFVFVLLCTVLLLPAGYPIAFFKYTHINKMEIMLVI